MTIGPPTERTRVRRIASRGAYDRETVHAILDEARFCHVGFVDGGQPVVLPTIHARIGDTLYLHGSTASRMLEAATGAPVCVTATILDGLVLARSAFHHSMNYRSVVAFGVPYTVEDESEKRAALDAVVEHVLAGRGVEARPPSPKELAATRVFALSLDEASAKIRSGPPIDDEADLGSARWAGVVPLHTIPAAPEADPALEAGAATPASVRRLLSGTR